MVKEANYDVYASRLPLILNYDNYNMDDVLYILNDPELRLSYKINKIFGFSWNKCLKFEKQFSHLDKDVKEAILQGIKNRSIPLMTSEDIKEYNDREAELQRIRARVYKDPNWCYKNNKYGFLTTK